MTLAILLVACLGLAGAVGALAVALSRVRSALATELAGLRAEVASAGTSRTEADVTPTVVPTDEYVITRLGDAPESAPAPTLETRLFTDIVLR
jgi:hypothetical protein